MRGVNQFANRVRRSTRQTAARQQRVNSLRRHRRSAISGIGVTAQHDISNVYRKRRMSGYRRRRWRNFVGKVNAVAERDLGTRTVVFNESVECANNQAGKHVCLSVALYGQQSTLAYMNDLNTLAAVENFEANPTTAAGISVEKSTKYFFHSAVLDLTVRNTSFASDTAALEGKMEVDVYEISLRKDAIIGNAGQSHLSNVLNNAFTDTKNTGGAGTGISIESRGVTPFDCPYGLSRYGIKVWSKKKYFLESGSTFTYQVRDPRRHVCDQNDMNDRQGFNRPGWTRIVFFIGKLIPGYALGTTAGTHTEEITVGVTRKYMYKMEGANDDRDRYIGNTTTIVAVNPA